jgi:hypothetical protein
MGVTRLSAYGRGGTVPPVAQRGVFHHQPPTLKSSSSLLVYLDVPSGALNGVTRLVGGSVTVAVLIPYIDE